MRTASLRKTANRYLKMNHRGSLKDKQHQSFVIHKMIDDLFALRDVPPSWQTLNTPHIHQLVGHWQKQRLKPATIMRYMTVIRRFLETLGCQLANIDNQSLGLSRHSKTQKRLKVQPYVWQFMQQPSAYFIMALQMEFGLTYSEAIHFTPHINIQNDALWITREIAFNSEDRFIPLRFESQTLLLTELTKHLNGSKSLLAHHGQDEIRYQWHHALTNLNLPTNKHYRYIYAQTLKRALSPTINPYQLNWLIRDEMGIKSRNTLWMYLNE